MIVSSKLVMLGDRAQTCSQAHMNNGAKLKLRRKKKEHNDWLIS